MRKYIDLLRMVLRLLRRRAQLACGKAAEATQHCYVCAPCRVRYITHPGVPARTYRIPWHHRLYNAIKSTIRSPTHLSDARVLTADELQKYQTSEVNVPYYNDVSEAVFSISIRREPHSFIFNFAVRGRPTASL